MKDDTQSAALIESRTLNKSGAREIETIEIGQPSINYQSERLDVVFVVDVTGSMSGTIGVVQSALSQAATELGVRFNSIKFGLVTFKDEDEVFFSPNENLQTQSEVSANLLLLDSSGGLDVEEAGYLGVVKACNEINWRTQPPASRAIVLLTDAASHERGATQSEAIAALLGSGVSFYFTTTYDISGSENYTPLASATEGQQIAYSPEPATLASNIANALLQIQTIEGTLPIFISNDNAPFTAYDENNIERTFLPRSFLIDVTVDGIDGTKSISMTIDNTDKAVSRYLSDAIKNNLPVAVTYRLYLSNDSTGPQTTPPLKVYLSGAKVFGSVVSGTLGWVNLVDASFPNKFYDRSKFPSL